MKTAYLHEEDAPGSRHYKFSCVNGKVQVEPCGEFRDSVCKSAVDTTKSGLITSNFETATCIDNKWEKCTSCKSSWYSFVPWADWGDCKKSECEALGDCVYNSQDTNECWPKYPPGFEFIDLKTSSAPTGQDPSLCSVCGAGSGQQCDDNECQSMGDCDFKDTTSVVEGIVIGGTIGFAVGVGAAMGVGGAGATATEAGATATTGAKIKSALTHAIWIPQMYEQVKRLWSDNQVQANGQVDEIDGPDNSLEEHYGEKTE